MITLMPFGKHRGKPITQVPLPYLRWAKRNLTLHGELAEAIDAMLGHKPLPLSLEEKAEKIIFHN